jgi:hypothetical protein
VLGQVEDLPGEEDPGTERDRAERVESGGERRKGAFRERPGDVEDRHHGEHEGEPRGRGDLVPMGRDEEEDPGADQQHAEPEGQNDRPAQTARLLAVALEDTDLLRRGLFEKPRIHPALKRRGQPVRHFVACAPIVVPEGDESQPAEASPRHPSP